VGTEMTKKGSLEAAQELFATHGLDDEKESVGEDRDDQGRFVAKSDDPAPEAAPDPAPEAVPDSAPEAAMVDIVYKGRTIQKPISEVVNLAQKGFAFETKNAELDRESSDFKNYLEYKSMLEGNQELANVIADALVYNSQSGMVPRLVQHGGELDHGEAPVSAVMPAADRARLNNIEAYQQQQIMQEAQADLSHRMTNAIQNNPALAALSRQSLTGSGGTQDAALDLLAGQLASDPSADVDAEAALLSSRLRYLAPSQGEASGAVATNAVSHSAPTSSAPTDTYLAGKKSDEQVFRSEPAQGADGMVPSPVTPERLTGRDLESGKVRRGALDFLRSRILT